MMLNKLLTSVQQMESKLNVVVELLCEKERLRNEGLKVARHLLTAEEVMKRLKMSPTTLYKYTKAGAFDTRTFGRRVYYCEDSVMKLDEN